jgi:hypothetical protein
MDLLVACKLLPELLVDLGNHRSVVDEDLMKQRLQEAFLTTVASLKEVPRLEKSACPGHFPFRQSSIRLWMLKDVFHQRRFSRPGFADNPVGSA